MAQAGDPVELEVLGQITVHTETELTDGGLQLVRGRLSDEVGKPVGGTLNVRRLDGSVVTTAPCPGIETLAPEVPRKSATVGALTVPDSGEFCFVSEEARGLIIAASGEHLIATKHDLDLGAERQLVGPRFVHAPATIDLHEQTSVVVEVLARGEHAPPQGAQLSLSLKCLTDQMIERVAADAASMIRFEFKVPQGVAPGTCQLIAEVRAKDHKPLATTRNVLVRDLVRLSVETQVGADVATLHVGVKGSAEESPTKLNEGVVEVRENGAFVALGPVRDGVAVLEVESTQFEREVALAYLPASSAYVPDAPLLILVPARAEGFRWAGVHTLLLSVFALWLGYAWLKPGRPLTRIQQEVPPKRATVKSAGKKTGPIYGQVRDAHTATPLADVRLLLQTVGTETKTTLEETTTSVQGEFRFKTLLESNALIRLHVSASEHMTLESTVLSAELTVHLTHRRRAVLAQLIGWAKNKGRPWESKLTPTPGSVEGIALIRNDVETAKWARSVAEAAYAPSLPSEEHVLELRTPVSGADQKPSP